MIIIVIDCEDLPKWEGWNLRLWPAVFAGISASAQWQRFHAPAGELPTVEQVQSADLVVITGSHYSAYEKLEWIDRMVEELPKFVATGTRVLGCCFGHQVLARALGGHVAPNPSGRFVLRVEDVRVDVRRLERLGLLGSLCAAAPHSATPPLDEPLAALSATAVTQPQTQQQQQQQGDDGQGHEVVAASQTSESAPAVPGPRCSGGGGGGVPDQAPLPICGTEPRPLAPAADQAAPAHAGHCLPAGGGAHALGPGEGLRLLGGDVDVGVLTLQLVESHGDSVTQLPPGAVLLAQSGTARHEMWALGGNVLAFQFHPEMPPELAAEKIWPTVSASGRLSNAESKFSRDSLAQRKPSTPAFHAMLHHFARHGLKQQSLGLQDEPEMGSTTASTTLDSGPAPATGVSSAKVSTASAEAGAAAGTAPAAIRPAAASGSGSAAVEVGPGGAAAPRPPPPPAPVEAASQALAPVLSFKAATVAQAAQESRRRAAEGSLEALLASARTGVVAGLEHTLAECRQLAQMNHMAAGACGSAAERARQLGQQCEAVQLQASSVAKTLESLPQMEALLDGLSKVVDSLDAQSRALAAKLNVPEGAGVFSWLTSAPAAPGAPAASATASSGKVALGASPASAERS